MKVVRNYPPPRTTEALLQCREKFARGGIPREIIEAAMEEARTQRSDTLRAFAARTLRWIRCRKSARETPSFAGGPRLVCPLAADRFGYRFFGQLFRTLRLAPDGDAMFPGTRSEEHTSELQSLMRISYAVFCLKKKTTKTT